MKGGSEKVPKAKPLAAVQPSPSTITLLSAYEHGSPWRSRHCSHGACGRFIGLKASVKSYAGMEHLPRSPTIFVATDSPCLSGKLSIHVGELNTAHAIQIHSFNSVPMLDSETDGEALLMALLSILLICHVSCCLNAAHLSEQPFDLSCMLICIPHSERHAVYT